MNPLAIAAGVKGAGALAGGVMDYFGADAAAAAKRKAQSAARGDLVSGYDKAEGFQKPLYDTGIDQYQTLAGRYGAGELTNPHMNPLEFDPQSVFQDPEYQASMRSGTEAINSGANANSMLFSGVNARDLNQFGQDTFAKRSDALYKRGFDAQNTAFDQNAQTNLTDFNMGNTLSQPAIGSANLLTGLSQERGQDLANNSLGTGNINAKRISDKYGAIGSGINNLTDIGADYLLGKGIKKGP